MNIAMVFIPMMKFLLLPSKAAALPHGGCVPRSISPVFLLLNNTPKSLQSYHWPVLDVQLEKCARHLFHQPRPMPTNSADCRKSESLRLPQKREP